MEVTFTKGPGRAYTVAIRRAKPPELAPRRGPGSHPYLPHDLVHLVVEAEAGLRGGVFGRIAAGSSGMFWPADPAQRRRTRRRESRRKPTAAQSADMGRSEELAQLCLTLWEIRRGHRDKLPAYLADADTSGPLVDRIVNRLDHLADRWHALPEGGSLTVEFADA